MTSSSSRGTRREPADERFSIAVSKLYFTESGHVITNFGEEITAFRRARKTLQLPGTRHPATLYVLARPHRPDGPPMRVSVNGAGLPPLPPHTVPIHLWREVTIPPELLRAGVNTFDFWTDTTSMTGWSLTIEPGHVKSGSYVSDDAGESWRNVSMGYLNVVSGEYTVRVRIEEGHDPPPPGPAWDDPANPRLVSLRRILPPEAMDGRPFMERIRVLASWLASAWEHTGSNIATQFAPWDAETILAWGTSQCGHDGRRPVVACIHYGVAFVSSCQALGFPARCAILIGTPNGTDGHFCAEVWSKEHRKWVFVDPNVDALFFRDDEPLSLSEVQSALPDLTGLVRFGTGFQSQKKNPRISAWLDGYCEGKYFRHRSAWYRSDFLTRPDLTPPAHGAVSYCETGLVWDAAHRKSFGMFPYFGDKTYFEDPPGQAEPLPRILN